MKAQNQKSSRFAGLTESELAKLIQQYGCGPVRFSGTDEALYERHLVFDNVMEMSAIGARERFEAIAHSVRDAFHLPPKSKSFFTKLVILRALRHAPLA